MSVATPGRFAWLERLPLSREGLFWLLIAAAMLVTGLFKGINLITLLACWIIVLTALNGWLARRQLLHLHAERRVPDLIFAEMPFRWSLQLANRGRRIAHSITVRDDGVGQTWFVGHLRPGGETRLDVEAILPRRGACPKAALRLTCGYPVGLAQLTRRIGAEEEVLAAPRLGRLQRGVFRHWLSQHCPGLGLVRAAAHRHPAAHTEFHGLRAFRPGDSPRHIHWRTTARRDELMVREFEDWPNDNVILLIDPWTPLPAAPGDNPDFERLLSLAATILWEWCRQKGDEVVVGIAGREPVRLDGVTGQAFAVRGLRALATVDGDPAADFGSLLERLEEAALPAAAIVVLSLRCEPLAELVHSRLHRPAGQLNVGAGEERDFFDAL
jgi:uncharacterized protein (DUF58 family)